MRSAFASPEPTSGLLPKEFRLAVIELGSAAELSLWAVYDSQTKRSTEKERSTWTLGTLTHKVYANDEATRDELLRVLVAPRNDAIHRADPLTRSIALEAFSRVRDLISAELDELLPQT